MMTMAEAYHVTWRDSIEWLQIILVFTIVNWLHALIGAIIPFIILWHYGLAPYMSTALAGYAVFNTVFLLRNWPLLRKSMKIDIANIDFKKQFLTTSITSGLIATAYALIGVLSGIVWVPMLLAVWDHYLVEKRLWYLTITGWILAIKITLFDKPKIDKQQSLFNLGAISLLIALGLFKKL